jgi:hypothetical protein
LRAVGAAGVGSEKKGNRGLGCVGHFVRRRVNVNGRGRFNLIFSCLSRVLSVSECSTG